MQKKLPQTPVQTNTILKRFIVVVFFSIAFAYIEAALVVYLRTIFYPEGFTFPLSNFGTDPLWARLFWTEVGREAATLVLILSGAWLIGRNIRERFALFLTIFAVWDIFYYVWLKVLIGWPDSMMDWDVLFLIPTVWASPVLAPVLISGTLLIFAIILYQGSETRPIKANLTDWLGFIAAALVVVISLCTAGPYVSEPDFQAHFYWPVFVVGHIAGIALFFKCLLRSKSSRQVLPVTKNR